MILNSNELEIKAYRNKTGKEPFGSWFCKLEYEVQNIILTRLNRIKLSNFGDCKRIDQNIFELRINSGPGYRIYFTKMNRAIVLLCAGDKSSQKKDIKNAKNYILTL